MFDKCVCLDLVLGPGHTAGYSGGDSGGGVEFGSSELLSFYLR